MVEIMIIKITAMSVFFLCLNEDDDRSDRSSVAIDDDRARSILFSFNFFSLVTFRVAEDG